MLGQARVFHETNSLFVGWKKREVTDQPDRMLSKRLAVIVITHGSGGQCQEKFNHSLRPPDQVRSEMRPLLDQEEQLAHLREQTINPFRYIAADASRVGGMGISRTYGIRKIGHAPSPVEAATITCSSRRLYPFPLPLQHDMPKSHHVGCKLGRFVAINHTFPL